MVFSNLRLIDEKENENKENIEQNQMNDENLRNNNVNVDNQIRNNEQNINGQINNSNNFNDDLQNNSTENEQNIDVEGKQNQKVASHNYDLRNRATIQAPNFDDFITELQLDDESIDCLCATECDECVLDCLFASDCDEPNSFDDAVNSERSRAWKAAMNEEIQALKNNKTWVLVKAPKDAQILTIRWVFKSKPPLNDGEKEREKAKLVARGCFQETIDQYHKLMRFQSKG